MGWAALEDTEFYNSTEAFQQKLNTQFSYVRLK